MAGTETKIVAVAEATGRNEFRSLALRLSTTPRLLAEAAIMQLLVAAEGGDVPAMAPLEPSDGGSGVPVWLDGPTEARLEALGKRVGRSLDDLAALAVRRLLAQARVGATPMLKPLEAAPEPSAEAAGRLADCNFEKARLTINKLDVLADLGADSQKPRAHIDFMATLDELTTFKPF